MAWPVPEQYPVTTAYGKRGTSWSCNENSSGQGVHTGVDLACPSNTPLYATIAGTIRHRQYGSAFGDRQFAISPSAGQPFANGEVFYAHGNERLPDGTEVQVGDYVGKSGARGNVSGPHVHYEYHPNAKNSWNCSVHADPAPTMSKTGGGSGSSGPYVTKDVYRSKCGYGEPTNGDDSSDTVKELQERLNRISLEGGQDLPVTGNYLDMTDAEVRRWQEQICGDTPDPAQRSYLGPKQFAEMFPDSIYTLHDDGDPAIASGGSTPPPVEEVPPADGTVSGTTLGTHLKAQGWVVHDDGVPLGRTSEWIGVTFLMLHHTGGPGDDTAKPADLANYIRTGGAGAEVSTFPPLAQIFLDKNGEVWITCAERTGQPSPGRASHAGEGEGYGVPDDSMNPRCLGVEVQCNGSHPLSTHDVTYDATVRLFADLRKFYGVSKDEVIGHKEWSTTGKKDPIDDMNRVRDDIEAAVLGTWGQEPPVIEEPPIEPEPPKPTTFTFQLTVSTEDPPPVADPGVSVGSIWIKY